LFWLALSASALPQQRAETGHNFECAPLNSAQSPMPFTIAVDSAGCSPLSWPINIQIRKAGLADMPIVAEFNLRLAEETEQLHLDPETVNAGVTAILGDESKGIYHVAVVDGQVAGQLMITYEWSDWRNGNIWWIQSVYVEKEFRRHGIFRALFKYLEQLARAHPDVCGIRLYMHDSNSRARQSYENLGMALTHYEIFEMDFSTERRAGKG
jgi:GNAT superfamily N-acetyltransferase